MQLRSIKTLKCGTEEYGLFPLPQGVGDGRIRLNTVTQTGK